VVVERVGLLVAEVAVAGISVMTQMMVENKQIVEWVEQKILDKKYL
jgi:hypothetical protein